MGESVFYKVRDNTLKEIDLISELIHQAPALAILAYLVFYLVRTLSRQQKLLIEQLKDSNEQSNKIVSKNSEVIGSATIVMDNCSSSLDELKLELARGNGKHLRDS